MRPIIATVGFETDKYKAVPDVYIKAVLQAGGVPIIIDDESELAETYTDMFDGLLLAGGCDIAPHFYGEETDARTNGINERRDKAELALFAEAVKKNKPVLGICRGMQLINVALGGTLFQHIDGHSGDIRHNIGLADGCLLSKIFGRNNVTVNSSHHQCVKRLGTNLIATSYSDDGIIESLESENGLITAVQFHPERILSEDKGFIKIFEHFVADSANIIA